MQEFTEITTLQPSHLIFLLRLMVALGEESGMRFAKPKVKPKSKSNSLIVSSSLLPQKKQEDRGAQYSYTYHPLASQEQTRK
jgi:hypothetical protein